MFFPSIHTKLKALVITDSRMMINLLSKAQRIIHNCFDIREHNLLKLMQQLQAYDWNHLLEET